MQILISISQVEKYSLAFTQRIVLNISIKCINCKGFFRTIFSQFTAFTLQMSFDFIAKKYGVEG